MNKSTDVQYPIVFDVCDLLYYFAKAKRPSGIQRVMMQIILLLIADLELLSHVRFVSFNNMSGEYLELEHRKVLDFVQTLSTFGLTSNWSASCQRTEKGDFSDFGSSSLDLPPGGEARFFLLGAGWAYDGIPALRDLRERGCIRLTLMVHDLIPLRFPDFFDAGVIEPFRRFIIPALELADEVLTNSEYTRRDVEALAKEHGIAGLPVRAIRLGTFSSGKETSRSPEGLPVLGPYVLFVATIEVRKNHLMIVKIWQELLAEGLDVPALVLVGRHGWYVETLLRLLRETDHLEGKVINPQEVSDEVLAALYREAKFVVFPSFCEGWGLPVTEALSFGTPVLASNATAIPEAGGNTAIYLDPNDKAAWKDAIKRWIIHPNPREEIDFAAFSPPSWKDALEAILASSGKKAARAKSFNPPVLEANREYTFANPLSTHQEKRTLIAESLFLPDRLSDSDYLAADCRRGPGWLPRESWGCWTNYLSRPRLRFQIMSNQLMMGVFIRFPNEIIFDIIGVSLAGRLTQITIPRGCAILVLDISDVPNGALDLQFSLIASDSTKRSIMERFGRPLGIGFESIFLSKGDNTSIWLNASATLARRRGELVILKATK